MNVEMASYDSCDSTQRNRSGSTDTLIESPNSVTTVKTPDFYRFLKTCYFVCIGAINVGAAVILLIALQIMALTGHSVVDPVVLRAIFVALVGLGTLMTGLLVCKTPRKINRDVWGKQIVLSLIGLGVLILCVVDIYITLKCYHELTKLVPEAEVICEIVYNGLRFFFILSQLFFIVYKAPKFQCSLFNNIALVIILSVNAFVWIYYLALESTDGMNSFSMYNIPNIGTTPPPNATAIQKCLYGETLANITHWLWPTNTEFPLLILVMYLEIWDASSNDSSNVHPSENQTNPNNDANIPSNSKCWGCCTSMFTTLNVTCFIVTVPITTLHLVLAIIGIDHDLHQILVYVMLGYKCIMCLVIMVCTHSIVGEMDWDADKSKLKISDVILFSCTFSSALYYMSVITADFEMGKKVEMARYLISIVSVSLQTNLLTLAKRCVPKIDTYDVQNSGKWKCCVGSRQLCSSLCAILACMNISFWLVDSFVGKKYAAFAGPKELFFGEEYWGFILHFIYPLVIFYRIESAFHFRDLAYSFNEIK